MRDSIGERHLRHLLQPIPCWPSQYFALVKRKGGHEPERRLVAALLEDAVECFQKHLRARDPKARQLFLDAEEWDLLRRPQFGPFHSKMCVTCCKSIRVSAAAG